MTTTLGLLLIGFILLVGGGELLVRGASALARLLGVQPGVIGLTIVAAGTSMPELVVSLRAAFAGSGDIAVGNVVGSNLFNIGAILGLAALVAPLRLTGRSVRLEWPVTLLAALQLWLLARDGYLDRIEGGFFMVALVTFVAYTVQIARRGLAPEEALQLVEASQHGTSSRSVSVVQLVLGCALLAVGAQLLVTAAVELARSAGVSETVIGLTVIAAGTSLPELTASVVAALRGHDDLAVANVLGSNVFNVLGIAGCTALVHPLAVDPEVLERDIPCMVALTLLLFPLMRSGLRVNRLEGAFLLLVFGGYMVLLLKQATS